MQEPTAACTIQCYSGPAAAADPALPARRASLAACRAAPSALHTCRCPPSRQLASAHVVPQYQTARQPLRYRGAEGHKAQGC